MNDPQRLRRIAGEVGGLRVVFAGKAHPRDDEGKRLIQQIVRMKDSVAPEVKIVCLENYDWELARLIVAGVDVWLNTLQAPLEASGTSGMKAALNGVPSPSILDGWWIEGCVEGVTGWAFGDATPTETDHAFRLCSDAGSLYEKLEQVVVPKYHENRGEWLRIMSHAIALNASHFNTQRMIQQYVLKAYYR